MVGAKVGEDLVRLGQGWGWVCGGCQECRVMTVCFDWCVYHGYLKTDCNLIDLPFRKRLNGEPLKFTQEGIRFLSFNLD